VAREAVAETGAERREERRWNELDHRDEPGSRRAAAVVRVHEHRDPGRPLGHVERREGEGDPP